MRMLLGRDLQPDSLTETLAPTVADFLENADAYVQQVRTVRSQYLYNFGCSEKAGTEYILRRLKEFEDIRKKQEAELAV